MPHLSNSGLFLNWSRNQKREKMINHRPTISEQAHHIEMILGIFLRADRLPSRRFSVTVDGQSEVTVLNGFPLHN